MCDVDEEFEAEGETLAHEPRGDKDTAMAAAQLAVELDVAVADGRIAEVLGPGGGDHGLFDRLAAAAASC